MKLMCKFSYILLFLAIGSGWFQSTTIASDALFSEQTQFFESKIRPVLVEHCYRCHSSKSEKLRGGLLLDSLAGWKRGGDSGVPIIVPGDSKASALMRAVRHEDGLEMPPSGKLPDRILADLARWIEMGAPDPRTEQPIEARRADKTWWSLQPLTLVQPPIVPDIPLHWQNNPIDQFVFAELRKLDLLPNPPADAHSLIRRLTYDLHGLPATYEETIDFVTQYSQIGLQGAVEKLVDRLLASPRYGEHWGRHWLDVVRFGESIGFERNVIVDTLWPFRDYVIRSLNDDKPFDEFIKEHLAGDVIGKDNPEIEIGSAFLVAGPYDDVGNQDPVAKANIRAATLDEIITATSSAFLGLTINCARCHHHKFDPIPSEDYYRLRAAFEGVEHGQRVIASPQQRQRYESLAQPLRQEKKKLADELDLLKKELDQRALELLKDRKYSRPKMDPQFTSEGFPPIEARFVKFAMYAHTGNPRSAVGSRLVEFEVWTAQSNPRNVALASLGAQASGAKSTEAEDFPEAYGSQFAIDGTFAEQWFIGAPAELLIRLPKLESVDRIAFANSRGEKIQRKGVQGETPCEYEILVSKDGVQWTAVATSADREPWSETHALERVRREIIQPDEQARLARLTNDVERLQSRLDAIPPLQTVFAGNYVQPKEPTRVHLGGDPMKPGSPVAAESLQVLSGVMPSYMLAADAPERERRFALARWIASDQNPLTARVLANRLWHYHFGTGIVDTPSDFGFLGGRPTHPQLLDWLAGRLQAHDWRLKPLHRELVLSQAYLQSSEFRLEAAAKDKDARRLWRFPPRRLSAEEIRDTLLRVSGELALAGGGPGFRLYKFTQNNVCTYFPLDRHGPETYRRAVYHQNARASVVDLLTDFDLPDIAFSAPKRASTTSPLQALTLLNHSFTLDMAQSLARRIERETLTTDLQQHVACAYRLTFQREPSAVELDAACQLAASYGLPTLCRALFNLTELINVE